MGDNMRAWSGEGSHADIMGPPVTRTVTPVVPPMLKNGAELRGTGYLVAVGSRTARFRRKHQSKLIPIILLFIIILLLALAIAMTVLYLKQKRVRPVLLCESKECLRSAANLAISMDPEVDPCDDFYKKPKAFKYVETAESNFMDSGLHYVCGNWEAEHPRPAAHHTYDWFNVKHGRVQRTLRDFLTRNHSAQPRPVRQAVDAYSACTDTDTLDELGLQPILDSLEMLGLPQYPTYLNVTDGFDYAAYGFDWLEAVVRVKTLLGMDVLVGFDIFSDPKNSTVYRLAMGSPGTTNPFPSMRSERKRHLGRRSSRFHLPPHTKSDDDFITSHFDDDSDEEDERISRLYKVYYAEVIKAVFLNSDGVKLTQLPESEIDNIILQAAGEYVSLTNIFYELESSDDNDTMDDDDYSYNIPEYTVDELQEETDRVVSINNGTARSLWRAYLTGVFNVSDVDVNFDEDKILVSEPDLKYLALLAAYLSKSAVVNIELYIWLQVVDVMVVHTTSEMRALHARYYALLRRGRGADEGAPARSLACAGAVNAMLGMAVSYAVADEDFVTTTKPKVELMLNNMKKSLINLIRDASWMDRATKEATFEKITQMRSLIGFPDWLLDEGKLQEFYQGVEVDPETHMKNMINIVQARLRKGLNKFHEPNNISWATDPTDVNAFHTFQDNTITVPLVMLQYPFYDLGLESLNYGALGTVLGHEITHGFDNIGRQFDSRGNMVPWWSNQTVDSFVNRTQCFVRQYSSIYLPETGDYINGKRTLSENIADNGGVREALGAYRMLRRRRDAAPERALPGFEHMSAEQLFFLSYGNLWCSAFNAASLKEDLEDVHSPNHVRPRGSLQNSEDFARAFRCRPNTTMNPHTRCIIF